MQRVSQAWQLPPALPSQSSSTALFHTKAGMQPCKPPGHLPTSITLAFSIPNPTVSLAYMQSSRFATRVMATRPSCPQRNSTCHTPAWSGPPAPQPGPQGGQGRAGPSPTYHAVHEDKFEVVLIERLVPILVIGHPDVAGDGCGDPGVSVPIARVGKQGPLVVQQPGKDMVGQIDASNTRPPFSTRSRANPPTQSRALLPRHPHFAGVLAGGGGSFKARKLCSGTRPEQGSAGLSLLCLLKQWDLPQAGQEPGGQTLHCAWPQVCAWPWHCAQGIPAPGIGNGARPQPHTLRTAPAPSVAQHRAGCMASVPCLPLVRPLAFPRQGERASLGRGRSRS